MAAITARMAASSSALDIGGSDLGCGAASRTHARSIARKRCRDRTVLGWVALKRLTSATSVEIRMACERVLRVQQLGSAMTFTTRPELRGTFGAVSSTHWLASTVGMSILEKGHTAF